MRDLEAEHTLCGVEQQPLDHAPDVEHLPEGWWLWVSEQDVTHAVPPAGPCATCGRAHEKDIAAQVRWLYYHQRQRENAVIDDGGHNALVRSWVEICRGTLDDCPDWVTPNAMREYLRCNGLSDNLAEHFEPPGSAE